MAETATRLIPAERLHAQIVAVLTAWGMTAEAICITADAMVSTCPAWPRTGFPC